MTSRHLIIGTALCVLLSSACDAEIVEEPVVVQEEEGESCEGIHTCSGFMVLLSHADFDGWEELLSEVQAAFSDLECHRDRGSSYDVICWPPGQSCGYDEEAGALALEQRFLDAYGDKASTFVEGCVCRGYC